MKDLRIAVGIPFWAMLCLLCHLSSSAQNVGIGTSTPASPLHVVGANASIARFDGPDNMYVSFYENGNYRGYIGSFSGNAPDMDFGTGAGNTTGRLHLTTGATPRFTISANGNVGIGTTNPLYKLHIIGSTDLEGPLYVNGSSGQAGQVLTSDGTNKPIWQNAALSNTVRFAARYQRTGSATTSLSLSNTYYNLSPADITIGSSSIIINKTGLYHFDGSINGLVQGSLAELPEMTLTLYFGGSFIFTYNLLTWKLMDKRTTPSNNYYHREPFSFDMHLPAGTSINMNAAYLSNSTITYQEATIYFFGYLISE